MKRTAKTKAKQKPAKSTQDTAQSFGLAALLAALAVVDNRLDEDGEEVSRVWGLMLADCLGELPESDERRVLKTAETLLAVISVQVRP
jgi:hypothetical protein